MTDIFDLDRCELSRKNGLYGGMAGSKDGIIIDGQNWLVKYPKNTRSMNNVDLSYTTAPLCEYLGSHIFSILGFNTHETILGIRNDKVVVACRDFTDEFSMLAEIRTIKNHANEQLSEKLGIELGETGDAHKVDLETLLTHIRHNPILTAVPGIERHFFRQAVVDIYINNSDRNNGNWGLIRYWDGRPDEIAPVFDNGGSFQDKLSEEKAERILADRARARIGACGTQTAYADKDGHIISCKKFLDLQNSYPELRKAIIDVVPSIKEKRDDIIALIQDLPCEVIGKHGERYEICGDHKKALFCLQLESRLEDMLIPAFEKALEVERAENAEREYSNEKCSHDDDEWEL